MAYENLCMYCFKDLNGEAVCPHCGKDSRTAVPQIQMLPGTTVYHDRFLIGRALGQDSNGIVYNAMDTRKGGTIRIREYLPRNCAERLNDGGVVPIAGMEDTFDAGMKKLRSSVEGVEDPSKRHFYFEENGTAYIAQRKNGAEAAVVGAESDADEGSDRRKQIILYLCIAAAIVLAIAIGLIWFLSSMSDPADVTLDKPLNTADVSATWMPLETPSPTPYVAPTFSALKDPELSWMDYTYAGDVEDDYNQQAAVSATKKPTVDTSENYQTINSNSGKSEIKKLQQHLVQLGWLDYSKVNGKYDSATKQAVKDFQKYVNEHCSPKEKLQVDGIAGRKTQQWLFNSSVSLTKPTPAPTPMVTPKPGEQTIDEKSSAADIRAVQKKLIFLGVMPEGSADGKYGAATKQAVQVFQKQVNKILGYTVLDVNGKVDALTMAYLNYYVSWWEEEKEKEAEPTQKPTQKPDNTPAPTEGSGAVDPSSGKTAISAMQTKLFKVGLLKNSDVDGVYGKGTFTAVETFQKWVNAVKGAKVVQVNGECDALTAAYLDYAVANGMKVPTDTPTEKPTDAPTEAPEEPTEAPTEIPEEPTEAPDEPDVPQEKDDDNEVDENSEPESISFVQEMLSSVGLLDSWDIDGEYGGKTVNAVMAFQQYVNDYYGKEVLPVSGKCDKETLRYLEYAFDRGMVIPTEAPEDEPETPVEDEPAEEDIYEPEEGKTEEVSTTVDASSEPESISFVQEMLAAIGMITDGEISGSYDEATVEAVTAFQKYVNEREGKAALEVTGSCDKDTLRYLEYAYDKGMDVGSEVYAPEPTEEPTEAPTPEPAVAEIVNFTATFDGAESDSGVNVLDEGSHEFGWFADSGVASYTITLLDGSGNIIKTATADGASGFSLDTSSMNFDEVYTIRIGALPENGSEDDMVYREIQMIRPQPVTPEPTEAPTQKPTVGVPAISIGSSVYQSEGITYIDDDTVIFSWMADGDVDYYTASLIYEDGTEYSLGTTNDTSKTLSTDQLQPGRYKLFVGAMPVGGDEDDLVTGEIWFAVPQPAEPEPEVEEEPEEEPEIEQPPVQEPTEITYIGPDSSESDIQTVQMALYRFGLLDTDSVNPGKLDYATLQAFAAFQQKLNEQYGAELYVIDPDVDSTIDAMTLDYLLRQSITPE